MGLACLGTWSDARRSLAVQEQIRTLLLPQAAVAAKDLALPQTAGSAVLQRCGDDAAFLPAPPPSAVRLPGLNRFALLGEGRRVAGVPGRAGFLHSHLPFVGARRRLGAFRRFRRAAEGMGRPGGGVARLVARGRVVSWSRTTDMTHDNAAHGPCGRWTEYSTQDITHEIVEKCIDCVE